MNFCLKFVISNVNCRVNTYALSAMNTKHENEPIYFSLHLKFIPIPENVAKLHKSIGTELWHDVGFVL